jgi:hypothetical protein
MDNAGGVEKGTNALLPTWRNNVKGITVVGSVSETRRTLSGQAKPGEFSWKYSGEGGFEFGMRVKMRCCEARKAGYFFRGIHRSALVLKEHIFEIMHFFSPSIAFY